MGGRPKGLLRAPSGETLVARWRAMFERLGIPAVLVGERPGYAAEGLEMVADSQPGLGPLGGLLSLLARGERYAISVACDMPYVTDALVSRLASAPPAIALAPRRGDRWEPFFARYDAHSCRAVAERHAEKGQTSLQALLYALGATELSMSDDEWGKLRDWDTPDDVTRP